MRRLLLFAIVFAPFSLSYGQETAPSEQKVRQAIERGLVFVEKDAAKWRDEKKCSTCHHGTMTAWVYAEALDRGFQVDPKLVADTNEWAMTRFDRIDLPRDERPGWSMVNSIALNFAAMAQAIPKQEVASKDLLQRISAHLLKHQETDGSWAWSSAPALNRPPPFFESDEVATRLGYMALGPHVRNADGENASIVTARANAAKWLKEQTPTNTTQSALLELLMRYRDGEKSDQLQPDIEKFLKRQNEDGGWGQLDDRDSDAFATGQSLYILRQLGLDRSRPEMQRGIAFLVANQQEDGSWPMTRRGHPGVTPGPFKMPIIYFGSAWGTLGLLRSSQ